MSAERPKRILFAVADWHFERQMVKGACGYFQANRPAEFRSSWSNLLDTNLHHFLTTAQTWKADGIIACVSSQRLARALQRSGIPAVNVWAIHRITAIPSVLPDNEAAGRLAAQHFLERGLRHLAFCGQRAYFYERLRWEGFSRQAGSASLDYLATEPEIKDWFSHCERIGRWLAGLPKPLGLFCRSDIEAVEALWACHGIGLRVPDDVAIVGTSNDDLFGTLAPIPLSSVDPGAYRVGCEAAKLLDALMQGHAPPKTPVLVEPAQLVVRQSSDLTATPDLEMAAAMGFIRRRAAEPIRVNEVLNEVMLSRRVLERRFKRAFGHSPKAEIQYLQIARAKTLLSTSEHPLAQVAVQSGFANTFAFYKAFKRVVGLAPGEYRKKYRSL